MNSQTDFGALAHIAEQVAAEWGFVLERPFMLSNYSYVAPAGDEAVMKVTPANDDESDEAADALALWDGDGAVRLLRQDREHRCLLLERARPGSDISGLHDEEATRVAVSVGLRLWRPAAAGTSRSIQSRCSASRSMTFPRSSGTRCRTGCGST